ncbi:type IV secretory system conjugative DNA transfer family protein [Arthrobacter sp. M-10]|uniref:type IV secretory system conjugative DNA transfer family protein n=1 Tax=Arthrobacter sp. M-10 TaxID=3233037 RepID=UPI003F91E16B
MRFDQERKSFLVTFPSDLSEERVLAMLRVLSSSIHSGIERVFGVKTIVFETWATSTGIKHRVLLPWQIADQVTSHMRNQIPGVIVEEDTERRRPTWNHAVEIEMVRPRHQLKVGNATDLSTGILTAAAHALKDGETAVLQWIITPTAGNSEFSIIGALLGREENPDDIKDRQKKLEQPNFLVSGRIAAVAPTDARAQFLVRGIVDVLKSSNGGTACLRVMGGSTTAVGQRLNQATTPWLFPCQFNVSELAALAGFPIGNPFIPGLPRASSRHLYATEEVARTGRLLGQSNYPGHKRPIAQDYKSAALHSFVSGTTGSGKSTLMANWVAQDMANGYGVIVIDASNSDSPETLFRRSLGYIPDSRLGDVIIMDVNKSLDRPVAFNVLDQGHSHMVVDQISRLIQQLYPDSKGVWTRELIHHGLYALIDYGNSTIMDLMALIRPNSETEKVWARDVARSVKDPRIRQFWEEWLASKDEERRTKSQPLYDRLWQFNNRPEIHNILGQTESAFQMQDILNQNKILLINLAGLPEETSALLGTLLFESLWTTAQSLTPAKENFVYLDEVQQMTKAVGLDDIMARGRKHKFGLTLSTQYLDGSKVSGETKSAIINNAGTKVIFAISAQEAKIWGNEFGRHITPDDFTNIRKFDAYAKIANDGGAGAPVSFTAAPPFEPRGNVAKAIELSSLKYGKPIEQVEADIAARRTPSKTSDNERPTLGPWKL